MKATFIRVSCRIPAGVTIGSDLRDTESSWGMDALLSSFSTRKLTKVESTAPMTLTFECPEALVDGLKAALQSLLTELS